MPRSRIILRVDVHVADLAVHPVEQRVGDRLVGHAERRAHALALVEHALGSSSSGAARQDVEVGRQDQDDLAARALLRPPGCASMQQRVLRRP